LQLQLDKPVLPTGEVEKAGQLMQTEDPASSWYEPDAHKVHVLRPVVFENFPGVHCVQKEEAAMFW
jgi:hypothetical protein